MSEYVTTDFHIFTAHPFSRRRPLRRRWVLLLARGGGGAAASSNPTHERKRDEMTNEAKPTTTDIRPNKGHAVEDVDLLTASTADGRRADGSVVTESTIRPRKGKAQER